MVVMVFHILLKRSYRSIFYTMSLCKIQTFLGEEKDINGSQAMSGDRVVVDNSVKSLCLVKASKNLKACHCSPALLANGAIVGIIALPADPKVLQYERAVPNNIYLFNSVKLGAIVHKLKAFATPLVIQERVRAKRI